VTDSLEAAHEKINVAKKPAPKTVYFDAPKGKALTDIPPPSINPMSEPGRSIIIVHRGRDTVVKTSPENVVVEKGESNGYVESKLVAANRATALGMNDAALEFYNDLYKKNQRDPRILMGRAVALQKAGDTQKAIDMYEQLLDIQQNNPDAITNLMGLLGKTKPAVALQNLLELRQKYPKNAAVAAQLGVAYADSGNFEDGLKYLNMAAGMEPENPQHLFNIAVLCEKMNDRASAIKYYEQAIDVYSINGASGGGTFSREVVYDRLAQLRGH
jgi:Flp pilus assembly protein TadD